jgi:hypothetical protein
MITRELGVSYVGPDKMSFVTLTAIHEGVVVLVLQDNPAYKRPMSAGVVMTILRDTAYWKESVRFSSLRKHVRSSP